MWYSNLWKFHFSTERCCISVKKYILCALSVVLAVQVCCCPLALAETTDAEMTTTTVGEATTTGADTEETTSADTPTTTTQVTSPTSLDGEQAVPTLLIILDRDGKLAARLTANGVPLVGVQVDFRIASISTKANTDENGYAVSSFPYPTDNVYVFCETERTVIDGVLYEKAAASYGIAPTNTTATSTETTVTQAGATAPSRTYRTNKQTTRGETKATKPITKYTASGTTGTEESYVVLEFAFDSTVTEAFDVQADTFAKHAKVLLSPENYTAILDGNTGVLTMSAAKSAAEVSDEEIERAVANDRVLSGISASKVKRLTVDMTMQCYDPTTGTAIDVWNVATGNYVIQLPVPQNMRSADTVAIAAVTADGITEPIYATVSKDGYLRFETTSPVGTIVLLGFSGSWLGSLNVISVVFLIVGLLCIGGAVFLYIRFVHRPKNAKKKEAEGESLNADEPSADEQGQMIEEPQVGLDIFSDEQPEPLTRKENPDIDIPL